MKRVALLLAACITACGAGGVQVSVTALPIPSVRVTTSPDVVLAGTDAAIVGSERIPFDGIEEGLAWPALAKAITPGEKVAIAASRETPTLAVLRAVWTLRAADVEVRTPAQNGLEGAILLRRKPSGGASSDACHAAVFVARDAALRLATPGGAIILRGGEALEQLVSSLDHASVTCPLRYVAFGAEQNDLPWGAVFDVAHEVSRANAAGDARFVLAEAIRAPR